MNFLRNSEEQYSLSGSLTPLVDIIFLLIIFFLVSSTFEKTEKNLLINLPGTKGKGAQIKKTEQWTVMIKKDQSIQLENKTYTLAELEGKVKENRIKKKNINIILKADEAVPYGKVAKIIGLFKEFGYKKLAFQTITE